MAARVQHMGELPRAPSGEGARVLMIEAPYYGAIAEALAAGAIAELEAAGASFERVAVPGALEIPLALAQGRADGRIKTGDLVLLEAMGGGFTWGAVLLRW